MPNSIFQRFLHSNYNLIIMGCGSSIGQVIDSKEGLFKVEQILVLNQPKQGSIAHGNIYLFGETRTHRKIIDCEAKLNTFKTVSNKTRIPCPKIILDPLETMYEESQQIFHLGIYGFSTLPPFNKMLALYLQTNIIFLCGGRDYDHYNVRNEVFFYSVDDIKVMGEMNNNNNELSPHALIKPKYSRNRFQKMGSMSKKRYSHMGIYSNKLKSVLIFGGKNEKDETLASQQIQREIDTWKDLPAMKVPRANAHCFEYAGKAYLFGGRSKPQKLSKKIEVFSLDQLTWSLLNIKIHRGIENALVFSQNPNEVLIVGGKTHFYACKTVIKIDLKEQTYIQDSELSSEYSNVKGVKMDEELLVFGGERDACQIYSNNKWKKGLFSHRKNVEFEQLQEFSFTQQSLVIKATENSQSEQKSCLVQENIFFGNDNYPCIVFFNKQTGKLRKVPVPMSLRLKKNMEIVQLSNKRYMLLGGSDRKERKLSRSCFIYDACTYKAKQLLKMSDKKISFAVVHYKNEVYVFGGYNPVLNFSVSSCQKFDLKEQKWTNICKLNKPKYKTFAQKIGHNKIAVFGKQLKNDPVKSIQIYHTQTDSFECYLLRDQVPDKISMLYSVEEGNKIVILREGQDETIQEIEITEKKLMQKDEDQQQLKTNQYKEEELIIVHKDAEKVQKIQVQPIKQKTEQDQLLSLQINNIVVVKPKMLEIKPLECQDDLQTVKSQKIPLSNKVPIQSQSSGQKLQLAQKQMPENPIQDELCVSIETHSLEANLTNLKFMQNTQSRLKDITIQQNIEQNSEKVRSLKHISQLNALCKQKHRIVKRQGQLYFFGESEIIVFDPNTTQKTTHKIQSDLPLKLSQIS